MAKERRRVVYSGRVQGVGFRFTCERLAAGFDVAGYVRNERDGTVLLVAEGEPDVLEQFLAAIRTAMNRNIRSVSVEREEPSDPFQSGFEIR